MEVASEAQNILSMMRAFSWPIFAGVILLIAKSGPIRNGYTLSENLKTTVGIVGVVAIFAGFSFLNVEGGDILDVIKNNPAWGIYVSCLGLATIAAVTNEAIRHLRRNRQVLCLSINEADPNGGAISQPTRKHVRVFVLSIVLWSIAMILAICWLWKISIGVRTS